MIAGADFLRDLVERFPQLEGDYACHLEDNGDPLPHVFFWDVTTAVMRAYNGTDAGYADLDWRGLIEHLEEAYPTAPLEVKEVIVTSFPHREVRVGPASWIINAPTSTPAPTRPRRTASRPAPAGLNRNTGTATAGRPRTGAPGRSR